MNSLLSAVFATVLALFFVPNEVLAQRTAGLPPKAANENLATNAISGTAAVATETVLSAGNLYNPIPSPDGTKIACVRTGWGRSFHASMGRSDLRSEVIVMDSTGREVTEKPLADAFLAGWTTDGKQLICYRDWRCMLVSVDGQVSHQATTASDRVDISPERVTFLSKSNCMVWIERGQGGSNIRSPELELVHNPGMFLGDMIIPSPDERYLAAIGSRLWVYDWNKSSWSDLGPVSIHPYSDWDYIQPMWNPWFRDSSRLVFVSEGKVIVATPDGKNKVVVASPGNNAAIPSPSPNGAFVSYVTLEQRAHEVLTNLTFWGNSTVWVVQSASPTPAIPVSEKNPATIYCLNWLNDNTLVLDRVSDEPFSIRAKIAKVSLKDELFAKFRRGED